MPQITQSSSLFWIIPLVLFCLYLPFCSAIDLYVAHFFSVDRQCSAPHWTWLVYTYGLIPGQLLFIGSGVICLILFVLRARTLPFFIALYLSLVLIVGGGLISHGLIKQFWQRPRPKQTTLCGGTYPYCDIFTRYSGEKDRNLRSLPSGHTTMGFYFFSFIFLGIRLKRRFLTIAGIVLSIILGGILSYARLVQGGHFLSDIILSLLIMWQSAYWIEGWLFDEREYNS